MKLTHRVWRELSIVGPRRALLLYARLYTRRLIIDHALRHIAVPPVTELFGTSAELHTEASGFVRGLLGPAAPTALPGSNPYAQEYEEVLRSLGERYREVTAVYPANWRVESETGVALYSLVRQCRPGIVVETGVADGHSTVLILEGLKRNRHGRLLSIDVSPHVGSLVGDGERERWDLAVLPQSGRRPALSALIRGISRIDLFVHDSDHSYRWQALEYALAWSRLSPDGILFTDDVDSSRAFFDFCVREGVRPALLLERRKLVGAVSKDRRQ